MPSLSDAPAVEAEGVVQDYGRSRVLHGIDLTVPRGGIVALLGPSGCGKTTLLRLVAGLMAPGRGRIRICGETVADAAAGLSLPPERRALGMVFQDYALWPHLSVGGNVAFPLEMRKVARAERERRVAAALQRVGLAGFERRGTGSLSGGQQQRVAIARAIVAEPRLVLFDEPLSNLDRELRDSLAGEIAEIVRGLGLSAVYVTHDHAEAFALADRVAVMRGGRIVQFAAPEELVDRPADPGVAEFLNLGTLADAEAQDAGWCLAGTGVPLPQPESGLNGARVARVLLPRAALGLAAPDAADVAGVVTRAQFRGDHYLLRVRVGPEQAGLEVTLSAACRARPGDVVGFRIDAARLRWFADPDSHPSQT